MAVMRQLMLRDKNNMANVYSYNTHLNIHTLLAVTKYFKISRVLDFPCSHCDLMDVMGRVYSFVDRYCN